MPTCRPNRTAARRLIQRCGLACTLLAALIAVPAAAQSPTPAGTPASSETPAPTASLPLLCSTGAQFGSCTIQLDRNQKEALIGVRIADSLERSPAGRVLSVTTSKCCVDTTVVRTDENGIATIEWSAETPPEDSVSLGVWTREGDRYRSKSIVLLPAAKPAPLRPVAFRDLRDPYAVTWVRGEYVPVPIRLQVQSAGGSDITRDECESMWFYFRPRMSGATSPDSVRAQWRQIPTRRRSRDKQHSGCVVETRWKLADAAGEQQMDVAVKGTAGMEYLEQRVIGFARQPPRLAVGYGYFRKVRADLTARCTTPDVHPECPRREVPPDSVPKVTYPGNTDGWQPYFGLELPIFLGYQPSNLPARYMYQHVRLMIGSTFARPQDNLLVGLTLFPLVSSASESSPFQLSVGLNKWRPYAGMALDAGQIIKPVLGALGVTGL